jgi:hypothetical protein
MAYLNSPEFNEEELRKNLASTVDFLTEFGNGYIPVKSEASE